MRKHILPLLFILTVSSSFVPGFTTSSDVLVATENFNDSSATGIVVDEKASVAAIAADLHTSMNLAAKGLSVEALQYAYTGYMNLKRQGKLGNENILTICDFSQSSRSKRLYIMDVAAKKLLINTYVAHGKNTGVDMATQFSNTPESLQSSLGFFVTKGTYFGKHGLSLKLSGQEAGWNSNAEDRAVVVHGANYIGEHRKGSSYMGRSFGCPAVPEEYKDEVINTIKNGSVLFIYHPSAKYLNSSKLLSL
jgi:hypothetical protein